LEVVSSELHTARPDVVGQLAIDTAQVRVGELERCGTQHRVYPRAAEGRGKHHVIQQVAIHPAQPPIHITERPLAKCQEHRVVVDRDHLHQWKAR
jgi:hypothetical protein